MAVVVLTDVVTAVVVLMEVVVFKAVVVFVEVVVLTDVAVFVCVEGLLVINFVTVCFCFPCVSEVLVLTDFVLVSLPPQNRYPRGCELVGETELVLVSLPLQKRNPQALVEETSVETSVDVDDDKKLVSARASWLGLWL
jgi:hypothetical protein